MMDSNCKLMSLYKSVIYSLVGVFCVGCAEIDTSVSKTSTQFWTPPSKEINAKQKQCDKLLNSDNSASILNGEKADLPMLINLAFENSPSTQRTWQSAKIAAAQSGQANSIFFPNIVVSGTAARTEQNTPASRSLATTFYPAVELQYSLFQFGGHKKHADAAKQLLYSANYQHNRELQKLAHEVQTKYFMLDSAENAIEASQRNLEDALVAYDAAFVRHQAGLSNIQDYLQAKANKTKAEYDLENTYAKLESARAQLAKTVGISVSNDFQIQRSGDYSDINDFEVDINELIIGALQTRQDLMSQHSVVQSKKDSVKVSTSKLLPELVIGGNGNKTHYHHPSGNYDNFNIYATLQWKLFDGFNNIYEIAEARARARQAECELKQLSLDIASDVWSNYHTFKSALKELNAARNYEQAAQESFDSVVIAYKNGLSSFNDLMTAQNQLAIARNQTISSKNNLSLSIVDLAYALGIINFDYKN